MKNYFVTFLFVIAGYFIWTAPPSYALNPALLQKLLLGLSKSSDDAAKHGDEVLKKATPKPDGPTTSSTPSDNLSLGGVGGRSAARNYRSCLPARNFRNKSEVLIVTGDRVNVRSCSSTECSVLRRVNKGRYRVNAVRQSDCWIELRFIQKNGQQRGGFISERYASVQ